MEDVEHRNLVHFLTTGDLPIELATSKSKRQYYKKRSSTFQLDGKGQLYKVCLIPLLWIFCKYMYIHAALPNLFQPWQIPSVNPLPNRP